MAIPDSVIAPVFVTVNVYVTVVPAPVTSAGSTDFTSASEATASTATVAMSSVDDIVDPDGGTPAAAAELTRLPPSMSACVTV